MRLSATGAHAVSSESNPVSAARTAGGGGGGGGSGRYSYLTNTDNLIYHIDFHNTDSYSGSGTSITDLSDSEFTTTILGTEDTHWTYISSDSASTKPAWHRTDGQDDGSIRATTSSSANFDFGTGDFSIEMWFRPHTDILNGFALFDTFKNTSGNTISGNPKTYIYVQYNGHNISSNKGKMRLFIKNMTPDPDESTNVYSTASWSGYHSSTNQWGDWNYVVVTRSGTSNKMYLNGTEIISATSDYTWDFDSSNNAAFSMGLDSSESDHGRIGAARVYKGVALSSSDITAHWDGERGAYGHGINLNITTSDDTLTEGETATITFTWTESVTGFSDSDITTTGGTLSAISGSGTTYTATFTPTDESTADGVITVGANAVNESYAAGDTLTMSVNTVTPEYSGTGSLSLRYHMHGSNIGTFEVYIEDTSDNSFTKILEKTGQQHVGTATEWSLLSYDLMPSFYGKDIHLWFIYGYPNQTGEDNHYKGDVAVDAITVTLDGSTSTYSCSNNTNTAKWYEGRNHSSLANAQSNSTWYTPNAANNYRRWKVDTGGETPSAGTGPDKAYNNNSGTDYLYFEASHSNIPNLDEWYPIRTKDTISVPS